jgi:nitrate reductase gamma subunit
MGRLLILAAYTVYAAFWIRFLMHGLVWLRATRNVMPSGPIRPVPLVKAAGLTLLDMLFLGRLFMVNPALWLGEWVFHASFLLVLLRHLRFFLNPVPDWIWALQTPGLIAGYMLPLSLVFILIIRLFTKREKYASPRNMVLLGLVLALSSVGLMMQTLFKPDLVGAKLFVYGLMACAPVVPPTSTLFFVHFSLFLLVVLLLPSHLVTAPLVMYEARKREELLSEVMHDE